MYQVLSFLLLYGFINIGIIAVGAASGMLLHWCFPGVELGTWILIGVIATGISIHFFFRLMYWLETYDGDRGGEETHRRIMYYPLPSPPPRPNRKRKPK
jgi:hypothetical protein